MDLSLDIGDYKLNIRAAGMFVHNNKVLVHRDNRKNHCCLPGGRIEIGENSEETVKREIKEELGKDIKIINYIATIENFFEMEGKKYHEFYFLYEVEFLNEEDKKIDYAMKNIEGKDYLQYEWIELDRINEKNLLPQCLNNIIKNKKYPVHIINNDIKKLK